MFISDIVFGMLAVSLTVALWVLFFFIFDTEVLNGYFKTKLQKRFNVEDLK